MRPPEARIERARPEDGDAILEVMRQWNMHHVPSPEMEELDLECFFVARSGDQVVGAAGYKVLSQSVGKTTLLGVLPEAGGSGIGAALQDARLQAMFALGVKRVITNADRPATIEWYKRRYGYREVGKLAKVCSFGDPDIDHWTTLELDLVGHMRRAGAKEAARDYVAENEPPPLATYPPLLVNACLTGMIPTREQTPHVPLTPAEIVEDAVAVFDAGARILHVHARDGDGCPTWRGEIYEEIVTGIRRERPEAIVCVSTSGRNWPELEKRAEVLDLTGDAKPDMASLTLGSLNFASGPSVNAPETIVALAERMRDRGIRPELEVFDAGMVGFARYLERKGIVGERKYFNLLLGSLGTMPATIGNLAYLVGSLPRDSVWAAAGIGMFQLPMNVAGIVAGGGVRVGLEDSIHLDYARNRLATNLELVERVVDIGTALQRVVASPEQAREMVGLEPRAVPTSARS